ncbi:MAG: leucine-rich repeat domain-containing protein [Oscillospiraceae bacterium]|nr:leucine-rich repeat domain-containing protein [Oscillospiraceae bacterium]
MTIPETVTSIGESAFGDCTSLTSVTIPGSAATIRARTFQNCTSLTSVTISEGVTAIGENAFSWCERLTAVTIPESVTTIGNGAFKGCRSLTSVTIPAGVKAIGAWTFMDCTSLTTVTVPEGLEVIQMRAFDHCTSLTAVTLPASVTKIGSDAFADCERLTTVTVLGERASRFPTPAQYQGLTGEYLIHVFRLLCRSFRVTDALSELTQRDLCTLLGNGYRDKAFLSAVERVRPHLLRYAVVHDDPLALRALLAMAPISDRDLEETIGLASEHGSKQSYIVLVNEKQRRGHIAGEEMRL